MNCRYCGSSNAAADHRCHRCGRRLHLAAARPAPDVYPVSGSVAPDSRLAPDVYPTQETNEKVPEAPRKAPYQPALFSTRDLGRVVPIEAYQQRAAERRERAREAETAGARQPPRGASLQTDLAFPPAPPPSIVGGTNRAASSAPDTRFSKAPVAIPVHRVMAAAMDFGMVLVAAGVISIILALGAKESLLPGQPLYWFAGLWAVLGALYKFFWAAVDADSPGVRWSQLKLLHFDGRVPSRTERIERIVWSGISILAGGLGLLWSVVDEESLSWHDHSSKTFLTHHSHPERRPQS